MLKAFGFLPGKGENFFHSRGVRNIPNHLRLWAGADLLFDLHTHGLEVEAHLLENINSHTLAEFDEAEKKMLGSHVVVVEPISFFAGQSEHLLCPWSEVVHHFFSLVAGVGILSLSISGCGTCSNLARIIVARKASLSSEDIF